MFSTIGIVFCLFAILKLFLYLWQNLQRKRFVWLVDSKKWAVITGATDGIGYEFALQLAEKGYNLMLISRNESKLAQTKSKILYNQRKLAETERTIQIETLAVDFSRTDIYDVIEQFLNVDINDIFVLVNNVGACLKLPNYFINKDENISELHQRIVNVNIMSTTKMTEMVLPSMMAKHRGLIINVSSFCSLFPTPMLSTYSASKSYIRYLSLALAEEYRRKNVLIHCLNPFFVTTKMIHHFENSFWIPDATTYVRSALKRIRYMDDFETTGIWNHQLLWWLFKMAMLLLPNQLFFSGTRRFMNNLKTEAQQLLMIEQKDIGKNFWKHIY